MPKEIKEQGKELKEFHFSEYSITILAENQEEAKKELGKHLKK